MTLSPSQPRRVAPAKSLQGEIAIPADKSISHRAVIFNALAGGRATIRNFLPGEDCLASIAALRNLGSTIDVVPESETATTVRLESPGATGWIEPGDVLDCGNSGTTLRLLSGALAGRPFLSILTGDASLRGRPMRRVIDPLRQMGAQISGRAGDTLAPLVIRGGSLAGLTYRSPIASAQVKTAILLAGLAAEGPTTVIEPSLSRDHSELLLGALGARLDREILADGSHRVTVYPGATLQALDLTVPGDISSAAFWMVAGLCHPWARLRLTGVGINPSRTGLIDVLRQMGGRLQLSDEKTIGGEPVADIEVQSSDLHGVDVGGGLIPRLIDEVPALAVAACFARGRTVVRDAAELRVKESDRVRTIATELGKLGGRISERPDGLEIEGTGRLAGGATVDSHGDHRLALALAVAGLLADQPLEIANAAAVAVSYPGFWATLERLAATDARP